MKAMEEKQTPGALKENGPMGVVEAKADEKPKEPSRAHGNFRAHGVRTLRRTAQPWLHPSPAARPVPSKIVSSKRPISFSRSSTSVGSRVNEVTGASSSSPQLPVEDT